MKMEVDLSSVMSELTVRELVDLLKRVKITLQHARDEVAVLTEMLKTVRLCRTCCAQT